jgi:hypothetical protein
MFIGLALLMLSTKVCASIKVVHGSQLETTVLLALLPFRVD